MIQLHHTVEGAMKSKAMMAGAGSPDLTENYIQLKQIYFDMISKLTVDIDQMAECFMVPHFNEHTTCICKLHNIALALFECTLVRANVQCSL